MNVAYEILNLMVTDLPVLAFSTVVDPFQEDIGASIFTLGNRLLQGKAYRMAHPAHVVIRTLNNAE